MPFALTSILFGIVFVHHFALDALEFATGKDAQQLPAKIQGLEDVAVFLVTLGNIALLKFFGELGVQQIGGDRAASPRMDISSLFSLPVA